MHDRRDERERQNVSVQVKRWYEDFTMRVSDFQSELEKIVTSIPKAYRDTAIIAFDTGWFDDSRGNMKVTYIRPETDEELNNRIAMRQTYENDRARHERAMYEVLKAKFEK